MNKVITALMIVAISSCAHKTSPVTVDNGVNPADISTALNKHVPQFRNCYQEELSEGQPKRIQGQAVLMFTVNDEGRVSQSNVQSSEMADGPAMKCMKVVLDGIQFPVPLKGKTYSVTQPMNFWPGKNNL